MKLKFILTSFLLLSLSYGFAQEKARYLKAVSNNETSIKIKSRLKTEAVVYGNFISRKGLTTSEGTESITVKNITTGLNYSMLVKPVLKTKNTNAFLFYIPPGEYEIINYVYVRDKMIVMDEWTYEPVLKGIDYSNPKDMDLLDKGVAKDVYKRFTFKIEAGVVNYVGNWDFNSGFIAFKADENRAVFNKKMKNRVNKKIDYSSAVTIIPK